jgi:hypothetical protein
MAKLSITLIPALALIGAVLAPALTLTALAQDAGEPMRDRRYPIRMDDWPSRIDAGHRLFVDDELIADRQGVTRFINQAKKHPGNPVVRPQLPWEDDMVLLYGSVIRDESTGTFRMWYLGRNFEDKNPMRTVVCYAESDDGIKWRKPELGLVDYKGTTANNIVMVNHGQGLDTIVVFIDPADTDPQRHFKMFIYQLNTPDRREGLYLYTSPDGLNWTERPRPIMPGVLRYPKNADEQFRDDILIDGIGDVTMVRYDPVLKRYIANLKTLMGPKRSRCLAESDDLIHWTRPRLILEPDERDGADQIYGMVGFPYESLWLGIVQRYFAGGDLTLDLTWAVSHDGRNWSRLEPRDAFLPVGPAGSWDSGNNSPSNSPPIRVRDELWFYYGGRNRSHNTRPTIGAIGLATLPVDRIAGLRARGRGVVTTRPLTFADGTLHVNADARNGSLRIELLDAETGEALKGYGLDSAAVLRADSMDKTVTWTAGDRLPSEAGPIRIRFVMDRCDLFSFWID